MTTKEKQLKQRVIIYSLMIIAIAGIHAASTRVSAQIAGGYADISTSSKDAKRAGAFAIKARIGATGKQITLVKILKTEVQVVAGLNYRVCLRYRDGRGRLANATAVVYKNLHNKLTLSRWTNGNCTDL